MARLIKLTVEAYNVLGYHIGETILVTEQEAYDAVHAGLATDAGNASTW